MRPATVSRRQAQRTSVRRGSSRDTRTFCKCIVCDDGSRFIDPTRTKFDWRFLECFPNGVRHGYDTVIHQPIDLILCESSAAADCRPDTRTIFRIEFRNTGFLLNAFRSFQAEPADFRADKYAA